MAFTDNWEVVAGEVATAAKMSQLGANDDYLKSKANQAAPPGVIQGFAGATAPDGWLLCNGAAVSRSTYADLFAQIGTTFGAGNGSTTFNVPDYRGRVIVGKSSDAEFSTIGQVGGEIKHQLTVGEMPAHNHSAWTDVQGYHNHRVANYGTSGSGYGLRDASNATSSGTGYTSVDGGHGHNVGIGNTGGNQGHNNLQPYLTANVIIKY